MRKRVVIEPHSGMLTLFDPAAVQLQRGERPDGETLARAARDGWLVRWEADDEEHGVLITLNEPLPASVARGCRTVVAEGALGFADGALLADPVHLAGSGVRATEDPPDRVALSLPAGRYAVRVSAIAWPDERHEQALRRLAGDWPVRGRDALAVIATILGLLTLLGAPLSVGLQWWNDGLVAAASRLFLMAGVLVPAWALLVWGWKRPLFRRVDAAERRVLRRYPSFVIECRALPGEPR